MPHERPRRRIATALAVGVVVVVLSRLLSAGGEYVAGPIAGALVHALPTAALTWAVATFGGYAETLFALAAAGLAAGLFALLAFSVGWLVARFRTDLGVIEAVATAVGTALFAGLLTGSPVHAIGLGLVAGAAVWLADRLDRPSGSTGRWSRRDAVSALGGGIFAGVGALAAGASTDTAEPELSLPDRTRREIEELRATARSRELDVSGLDGLLTPVEEFYTVDINIEPPAVDAETWSVSVDGAVDAETWSVSVDGAVDAGFELTRDRLDLFDPASELLTLRCIAEEMNAIRIGTAVWTGISVSALLDRAGPNGEYVKLVAVDRYSEVVPIEMLDDARLVYAMNGRALPREHGFPARIIVPGTWGKVNVKWVSGIEVLTEEEEGFWSEWAGTSSVNTVAKLWQANPTEDGMEVAGHAYAGSRGISAVEVSTDGGDTWNEATLSDPLPHPATWRQWRYEWTPERDSVEVVVRAVDGEGRLQPEEYSKPKPDGTTGWVSRRVETTESTDLTRGYRN